jgi:acetylornithine deacetylase/succinyl-diaminopimelate desuccinylase-like protein
MQAHVTDEWIALSQLDQAYELYRNLVQADG